MVNEEALWKEVTAFHGHACPGLAIGFKAALLAIDILDITRNKLEEDTVCVTENDACGVDALQYILGTTLGSGTLRLNVVGKNAYNIFNRKNNKKVRLFLKNLPSFPSKKERMEYILQTPAKELFLELVPSMDFPEFARIMESKKCDICNETTAIDYLDHIDGKNICKTCMQRSIN